MDVNTFYYTLSTIPQAVSAIVAVIGAFSIFRVQSLERILIGHGQSALNRWGSSGYGLADTALDRQQRMRLEDAVGRGSVEEIGAILASLREEEERQDRNLKTNPGGLTDLYERRFVPTHRRAKDLRRHTRALVVLSLGSILISVAALALADLIWGTPEFMKIAVLGANVFLFALVLAFALKLAWIGLSEHPGGRRNEGYHEGIVE
jgi:hypothetical protein